MAKQVDVSILKNSQERFEELQRIGVELEKQGKFHQDQDEPAPDSWYPVDENYPYIKKGLINSIKSALYYKGLRKYAKRINRELCNLTVEGKENLKGIKGAVVTCNHFSEIDSFPMMEVLGNIKFVANETNNWKNFIGDIMRNTGYIPLPGGLALKTMRKFNEAIAYNLKKGKKVLIYPEQAMWREYTKPRPLQKGAFHYAILNHVPVLPMFMTIEQKNPQTDEQGRHNFGNYTLHILPPIYPKAELSVKENEEYMKLENFRLWKEVYERVYGKKLTYTTDKDIWEKNYSEYNQFLSTNKPAYKKAPATPAAKPATKKPTSKK